MGGMGNKKAMGTISQRAQASLASGSNDGSVSAMDSGNGLDNNPGNQASPKQFRVPNGRGLGRSGGRYSKSKPRRLGR